MKKITRLALFILVCSVAMDALSDSTISTVPEPFRGFDDNSQFVIRYDDLTNLLRTVVVDVGRSTREIAAPSHAKTGTRMKASVKRSTLNEGNRFYYETFDDNEDALQFLSAIQKSLESVPAEVPLENFSRNEQLAYWLNLYNVTILNEINKIYPQRKLKKVLVGKKSILSKKLLNVAGVPLSLNDIQYTILRINYDNNPLIMYGLYQGNVGGPNIRKRAYTGSDVYRALENNAIEFTNSNRGTFSKDEKVFRVSSLYERNKVYFPNFETDLRKHLSGYLEGDERIEIKSAATIKPDIDDWTITDLGGTYRDLGAAFADNNAALLDSVKSTTPADGGGTMGAASGPASSMMASKGKPMSRFDPDLLEHLAEINVKRLGTNEQNATVTLEEMGEFPVEPKEDTDPEKKDDN